MNEVEKFTKELEELDFSGFVESAENMMASIQSCLAPVWEIIIDTVNIFNGFIVNYNIRIAKILGSDLVWIDTSATPNTPYIVNDVPGRYTHTIQQFHEFKPFLDPISWEVVSLWMALNWTDDDFERYLLEMSKLGIIGKLHQFTANCSYKTVAFLIVAEAYNDKIINTDRE